MKHTAPHTAHPLSVWYRFRRGLPLLLLPLLRLLRTPSAEGRLLTVSLWELAVALLLFLLAVARYRRQTAVLRGRLFVTRHGVWWRCRRYTPLRAVATVQFTRSPLMTLCRAVRLRIGTAAPCRELPLLFRRAALDNADRCALFRPLWFPRLVPLLVLAFSGSNAALGLLALVPLFRWLSGLPETQQLPAQALNTLQLFLSEDLPPLLRALAGLFLLGWSVAFIRSLVRYAGFSVARQPDTLQLKTGLLTRHTIYIHTAHITSVGLRQTLITGLLGLYTVSLAAAGYGRERDVRPVLLPALRRHTLRAALSALLPSVAADFRCIRPDRRAVYRYALPPLIGSLLSPVPLLYRPSLAPLTAVLCPLCLWWLLIRLWGHHRAVLGIANDGGCLLLGFPRGLALYEQRLFTRHIDSITLTRSPWQRRRGLCNITVACYGEKRRHTVRALPFEPTRRLIETIKTGR